jgi:hypothetical protein
MSWDFMYSIFYQPTSGPHRCSETIYDFVKCSWNYSYSFLISSCIVTVEFFLLKPGNHLISRGLNMNAAKDFEFNRIFMELLVFVIDYSV